MMISEYGQPAQESSAIYGDFSPSFGFLSVKQSHEQLNPSAKVLNIIRENSSSNIVGGPHPSKSPTVKS